MQLSRSDGEGHRMPTPLTVFECPKCGAIRSYGGLCRNMTTDKHSGYVLGERDDRPMMIPVKVYRAEDVEHLVKKGR